MDKPVHVHDCDNCHFLGTFTPQEGDYIGHTYDLYYCVDKVYHLPSIVARYGENGSYLSGIRFGRKDKEDFNSPLGEAWRRANESGFDLD